MLFLLCRVEFLYITLQLMLWSTQAQLMNCSRQNPPCKCFCQAGYSTVVRCAVSKLDNISSFVTRPLGIESLNLSYNGISIIPPGVFANFTNLRNLYFAHNKIKVIDEGAFEGLTNLKILDLKMNAINQWNTHYLAELPSLEEVDVAGNPYWTPNQSSRLFQHQTITVIKGLSLNPSCVDCTFLRNTTSVASCPRVSDVGYKTCTYCKQRTCRCTRRILQHFASLLQQNNLHFTKCRYSTEQCRKSLYENRIVNVCLENVGNSITFVYFAIGVVGILLNSVEILNILTTKRLRKNVSMLMVCNMALCDLLISTYVVLINAVHAAITFDQFQEKQHQICPFVGSLWLLGQIGTVLISTLLTTERYRAIFSAMKPGKKLTNTQVKICLAVTWLTAFVAVTYAAISNFFTYNFICLPVTGYPRFAHLYCYTFVLCIVGSLVYIANIPMYVHICVIVRRSRLNVGVKRESFLTKRVALLVATNIALVFLPMSIFAILISLRLLEDFDANKDVNYWVALAPVYVPLICLDLNSCVNPFLHAYRNEEFKKSLGRWKKCFCSQRKVPNRIDILRLDVHNLGQRNERESPQPTNPTAQSGVVNKAAVL